MSAPSRRTILSATAALMATTMRPATAAEVAAAGIGAPPVLPGGLTAYLAVFHNWAGDIQLD